MFALNLIFFFIFKLILGFWFVRFSAYFLIRFCLNNQVTLPHLVKLFTFALLAMRWSHVQVWYHAFYWLIVVIWVAIGKSELFWGRTGSFASFLGKWIYFWGQVLLEFTELFAHRKWGLTCLDYHDWSFWVRGNLKRVKILIFTLSSHWVHKLLC